MLIIFHKETAGLCLKMFNAFPIVLDPLSPTSNII